MLSGLSHVQLFATPRTVAHQAPLHGILQARMLEWVAVPSSRGSAQPKSRIFTTSAPCCSVAQSCPTLGLHGRQHSRLPGPWDFPGRNTGVGCHFLLQAPPRKPKLKNIKTKLIIIIAYRIQNLQLNKIPRCSAKAVGTVPELSSPVSASITSPGGLVKAELAQPHLRLSDS